MMNDSELDQRLEQFRAATDGTQYASELREIGARAAIEGTPDAREPARPRRTAWAWGIGMAAAAVVLTAGAAATSIYLEMPPFQGLAAGAIRTTESIPLRYETSNGIDIRCRIFLDFTNTTSEQVDAVDAAIASHDWSRFGQDIYDAQRNLPPAPPLAESLNPQDEVQDEVWPAVDAFAASVIPGLAYSPDAAAGQPLLSSIGETCVPSAQ